MNKTKAFLILSNGEIFEGISIGIKGETVGEIVFTTGMTGYQETLTDPSYYGQIVVQTFPLIGNYGINSLDSESYKPYVKGYIIKESCEYPSNFRKESTLEEFLCKNNIIGIKDIDTRKLTRIIREHGSMNVIITTKYPEDISIILDKIDQFEIEDSVKNVSIKEKQIFLPENSSKLTIALLDFGYKFNIRKELLKRGCTVIVLPYNTNMEDIKKLRPDGIMLSNGPGNPSENIEIIQNLKEISNLNIPIFGICLGHQLMALANNFNTEKLKYGHRGANQPIKDLEKEKIFITTQNHGYAVETLSVDRSIADISHINVNDNSCEGIKYKNKKIFTVQFHPEAAAGPNDTSYLFDEFIKIIESEL
ncbi:MAG: carbamoyl phosphate synthase small subunit [Oscillospiraceae bacterium]|nr:carbamoyl phosphate synthase small subunit [Oscillospiraceae bacterium]